jgi:hypothetical protein
MNMKKEWRESAEREFRKSPIFQTTQNMTWSLDKQKEISAEI